jgi:hypothetical protein
MPTRRVMGWIIRFIHNRDKATQNIVYQCSRAAMLGMIPSDVLEGLCSRFQATGTKIHERSVLMAPRAVMSAKKTADAGMFMVSIQPSRRNTKTNVTAKKRLRNQIRLHLEQTGRPTPARGTPVTVSVMTSGIWLNGRQWKEKMCATYTNAISRQRPDMASVGSIISYSVGSIISFHVYVGPDGKTIVIARVWRYRVHRTWKGMWIVHTEEPEENEYISVDRIVHGLHPIPHWDDSSKWIGIPWWKSI